MKEEAEKLEMALIFGLEALETGKIEWWGNNMKISLLDIKVSGN